MSALDWSAIHGIVDNFAAEFRISRQAAVRFEGALSRIDRQDRKIEALSEQVDQLQNRLRRREQAHKQQHRLIHKLIDQVKGLESELYVSTDESQPLSGHSRDGNESEDAVDALLRDDPTVNSPPTSPPVPLFNLQRTSGRSQPANSARNSRATTQPSSHSDPLLPSVSPRSTLTASSDEAAIRRLEEVLGMTPTRPSRPALTRSPSAPVIESKRSGEAPPPKANTAARHDPLPTTATSRTSRQKSADKRRRDANIARTVDDDRRAAVGTSTIVRVPGSDGADVDRPPPRSVRDASRARNAAPADTDENDAASVSVGSTSVASHYTTATDDSARHLDSSLTAWMPWGSTSTTSHTRLSPPLQPYPKIRPPKAPSSIASSIGHVPGSYPRTTSQSQIDIPPPVRAAALRSAPDLEGGFSSSQETIQPSQQPLRLSTQVTRKDFSDDVGAPPITLTPSQGSTLETIKMMGGSEGVRLVNVADQMGYYEDHELLRLDSDISVLIDNRLIRRIMNEPDDGENWLLQCTSPSAHRPFIVA